ncbi:trypsin-like serine peptidase [Paenibacillus sp. FSL H3-0286]|uniref:trypsin-like serine peptidase n=1 Tax=Paenibacillus sp. FSL H3-0286 TaxID=2921427 RepID=UPI0032500229
MDNKFNILDLSKEDEHKTLEYWTPERRAKAQPIQPPLVKEVSKHESQIMFKDHENIIIPGKGPKEAQSKTFFGEPFEPNVNEHPYHCGGKLFFKEVRDDGTTQDYVGSAQFVGHCSVILTAAHCVRNSENGKYYTDFVFSRGHIEGKQGEDFTFLRVGTHDKFVGSSGNYRRSLDYAFAFTNKPFDFWLGLQAGNPHNEFQSIGYPENYGENKKMFAVNGQKGVVKDNVVEMIGNPFKHGDSGGAWIVKINKDGGGLNNLAVGLNGGSDDKKNKYSPFFYHVDTMDLFYRIMDRQTC